MTRTNERTFRNLIAGFIRKQPPQRMVAVSFVLLILLGAALLCLPSATYEGVSITYIDALYMATSASTTTGLGVVNVYQTFSTFGRTVLAILMEIGGLGVTAWGAGLVLMMRRRINLTERLLFAESMNVTSARSIARFVVSVLTTTLAIELLGTLLCFVILMQYYPAMRAAELSVFHTIAAFNNAGMDIFGGQSIFEFRDNVWFNLVTVFIMMAGGLGFLVVRDLLDSRFRWRRLTLHTKVVVLMGVVLAVVGMFLIKLTQYHNITWLGAFFQAEAARMAGFTTYDLSQFSNGAIIVVATWMFIGCAPGSTTGGIRTTTVFVFIQQLKTVATNREAHAFHYTIPVEAFRKAASVTILSMLLCLFGVFLVAWLEPQLAIRDIVFENISAFSTAGMSTGITTQYGTAARLWFITLMFIGRVSPMTVLTMWYHSNGKHTHYPDGNITIG